MQLNTAFSFPADVSPTAVSTSTWKQRRKWADMALAVVFDEAGISPKGWRRHNLDGDDNSPGISRVSRGSVEGSGRRWAQATVYARKVGVTLVTFTVNGTDEVAVALREAAVRLGWGS